MKERQSEERKDHFELLSYLISWGRNRTQLQQTKMLLRHQHPQVLTDHPPPSSSFPPCPTAMNPSKHDRCLSLNFVRVFPNFPDHNQKSKWQWVRKVHACRRSGSKQPSKGIQSFILYQNLTDFLGGIVEFPLALIQAPFYLLAEQKISFPDRNSEMQSLINLGRFRSFHSDVI